MHKRAVGLLHQADGILRADTTRLRNHGLNCLHHRRFNSQRMHCHARQCAHLQGALHLTPEVEDPLHAQTSNLRDVRVVEQAQMVGAEQLAPHHGAAAAANIATQITKIGGASERYRTGRKCHEAAVNWGDVATKLANESTRRVAIQVRQTPSNC
jgi:hypothetical protein